MNYRDTSPGPDWRQVNIAPCYWVRDDGALVHKTPDGTRPCRPLVADSTHTLVDCLDDDLEPTEFREVGSSAVWYYSWGFDAPTPWARGVTAEPVAVTREDGTVQGTLEGPKTPPRALDSHRADPTKVHVMVGARWRTCEPGEPLCARGKPAAVVYCEDGRWKWRRGDVTGTAVSGRQAKKRAASFPVAGPTERDECWVPHALAGPTMCRWRPTTLAAALECRMAVWVRPDGSAGWRVEGTTGDARDHRAAKIAAGRTAKFLGVER